jgi:hypothetical protein
MEVHGLLDPVPLWILFLLTVAVTLGSVEVGYRVAQYRRKRAQEEKEAPIGAMVGATLGLLAFMLAFTFGMAANRFEARRQVVLQESNAIGTAYLRAAMLPEPMRTEARSRLKEYVDVRLEGVQPGKTAQAIAKSQELQNRLWSLASAVAEKDRTAITSLFIQSLNQVIDLHAQRIMAGLQSRIPSAIWIGLYLLAILAMSSMGYHQGFTSTRRSLAVITFVLAFSAVLLLISDLDRPGEGLLKVSQQSMLDLKNSMSVENQGP